jgi:hypothetical protein
VPTLRESDPTSAAKSSGPEKKPTTPTKPAEETGRLWTSDEGFVRPVVVAIGPSDGTMTEVSGSDVQEGMPVVIGEIIKGDLADTNETTNPFAPKLFGGKRSRP